MKDYSDIPLNEHLVIRSGDAYIGPFPPFEELVEEWAAKNDFVITGLERVKELGRENWEVRDYLVTDSLPDLCTYMVKLKDEPYWVNLYSEDYAKKWAKGEGAEKVADQTPVKVSHPHFLEKKPFRHLPPV